MSFWGKFGVKNLLQAVSPIDQACNFDSYTMHEIKGRHRKGSVAVINSNGSLQLRFNHAGKRRYLSLGLADNPGNRHKAEFKAHQIEEELFYDRLDPTLAKYKVERVLAVVPELKQSAVINIELPELWAKYCQVKKDTVAPGTWKNGYLVMSSHIERCPYKALDDAQKVFDWATANLTPDTAKRLLMQLGACCNWGMKSKLISDNPFDGLQAEIKLKKIISEDNDINPFTKQERDAIIAAFDKNRYYKHYADYVRFLFFTGARPSEVIALQWKHITDRKISFEQAVVAGEKGLVLKNGLKTQQKRKFPVNSQLLELLHRLKDSLDTTNTTIAPNALVFTSTGGKWIDVHNFRNRAWKVILDSLNIEYRKPYQTRHTFITMSLEAGVSIPQISK